MGVGDFVYNGVASAAATASGGGIAARISGNTSGTTALVSTGTLTLAGGNNITLSQVGNAITISGANSGASVTNSFWRPQFPGTPVGLVGGQSSAFFMPVQQYGYLTATQVNLPISLSVSSSSNSSHAGTLSVAVGIYTRAGSTLSSVSSGSTNYVWTDTAGQSSASLSGVRYVSVPININMTPGDYWVAFHSITATANANWISISNVMHTALAISGSWLTANNVFMQVMEGFGHLQTAALPASVSFGAMTGSNARDMGPQVLYFMNHS